MFTFQTWHWVRALFLSMFDRAGTTGPEQPQLFEPTERLRIAMAEKDRAISEAERIRVQIVLLRVRELIRASEDVATCETLALTPRSYGGARGREMKLALKLDAATLGTERDIAAIVRAGRALGRETARNGYPF